MLDRSPVSAISNWISACLLFMKEELTRLSKISVFLAVTAILLTQPALPQSGLSGALPNNAVPLTKNTPRPVVSGAAQVTGPYNPAQMLRLVLGLNHPNSAAEEQFLVDVQDRNSPLFHHFLTPDEWTARFSPSAADEQAVVDWATAQGLVVTKRFPDRLIIDVQAPVSVVNKAFGFTINNYQLGTISFFSNDRDPEVPSSLSNVLESVLGANNIQVVGPAIKNFKTEIGGNPYSAGPFLSSGGSGHKDAAKGATIPTSSKKGTTPNITNGYYDPSDIYASTAYNYDGLQNLGHCCNPTNNSGGTPADTSIAIATFSAYDTSTSKYRGGFAGSDISGFQSQYPYLAYHWEYYNIDGTPGECCDDETTLDIEWSTATSNSFGSYQDTAYIKPFIGANNYLSTFADVFTAIKSDNTTRIVSTSWDCAEDCWGSGGTATLHGIINSMSGEGWTIVVAAGDGGATSDCSTLSVNYPASDPDVVAAGGTTLYTGPGGFSSETGWTGGTYTGACSQNNGGGGGGCSVVYSAPVYQSSPACGSGSRSLPDMALNASIGENYYFNGTLSGVGGTSIVAPELAGFFAQSAAYVLYITTVTGNPDGCYGGGTGACLPLGNVNTFLYFFGHDPSYPYHYPFYDIKSGCNSNDVTAAKGTGYYCAGTGYDLVTGWGSANMLQLAWAINTYLAGNFSPPTVAFSGPAENTWYNSIQNVSWSITGHTADSNPVNGIAGYTAQWDASISDPTSEATPGSGNAFYSGPATPNSTTGSSNLPAVQGCHTLYVYAWDNAGYPSGNQSYGSICYDTVPPVTTDTLSGTLAGGTTYKSAVKVTLNASDPAPGSGVAHTYYEVNGEGWQNYSGPFTVGYTGSYTVYYYSTDVAGNAGSVLSASFKIEPVLTLSQGSLAFGNEVLHTTSAGKTVTLTNVSSASVAISSITPSGDFAISSKTCGSSLASKGTCTVTVTYTPSVVGAVSGVVTIGYSSLGSPDQLLLSGTGLVPLAVSPASLSFGTVTAGTTSAAQTLTLKNDNPSTALTISFSANGDYSAVAGGGTPCGATLAAAASCTVNVTFKPHQNGSIDGAVSIKDGVSLSPVVVALSGTGSGAVASPLTFTPASLTYAATVVASSRARTTTVKNVSASSVKISSISASGDYTSSGCVTTLASGASCDLTVTFKPSTTGALQGAIALNNNTVVSPEVLSVSGTGTLPLTIAPASVSFGTWTVGTTSGPSIITVTNHLATATSLSLKASGDFSASAGGGTPCGASLAAGASCTFAVSFSPTTSRPITGVATVTYSGAYSPQEVKLSGTGQ